MESASLGEGYKRCCAEVLAQYYARHLAKMELVYEEGYRAQLVLVSVCLGQGEGYYNKAQTLCDQEARRSNDVPLHLWKARDQKVYERSCSEAYALHCEGSTREAIMEAESCLGKRDSASRAVFCECDR